MLGVPGMGGESSGLVMGGERLLPVLGLMQGSFQVLCEHACVSKHGLLNVARHPRRHNANASDGHTVTGPYLDCRSLS